MEPTYTTAQDRESVGCPHCGIQILPGDLVVCCPACGMAHHRACWDGYGCGSYPCAPAARPVQAGQQKWTITAAEITAAQPQAPRPRIGAVATSFPPPSKPLPRTNRWAITSFICALAGIPLFGFITGAFAAVIGALALPTIARNRQKGRGLAITGIILGCVDFAAWLTLIILYFSYHPSMAVIPTIRTPEIADLVGLPPILRQAMLANVLIERRGFMGEAFGSGVILSLRDNQAQILTCRHVVDPDFTPDSVAQPPATSSLKTVDVSLIGQPSATGRVVWLAPFGVDLALVMVPCTSTAAAAATWGRDAFHGQIGDAVFAIGNPYAWGWSQSPGAIAQFRPLLAGNRELRVIQTTAPINPGNSGGGLYSSDGRLIGINTWIESAPSSQGLGFAIAMDSFLAVVPPEQITPQSPLFEVQHP